MVDTLCISDVQGSWHWHHTQEEEARDVAGTDVKPPQLSGLSAAQSESEMSEAEEVDVKPILDFTSEGNASPDRDCSVPEDGSIKAEVKSYPCIICYKIFSKHNYLTKHYLRVHPSDHPFKCEICNSTFTHSRKLANHYNTAHRASREKLYSCDLCGNSYNWRHNLLQHQRLNHPQDDADRGASNAQLQRDEKPFKCKDCEKCFSQKGNLYVHMTVHSKDKPHECEACHKSFARKHHLVRHYRVHTHEKPYRCDICGRSFAYESILTVHIRVHTQDKPFKCEICERSFSKTSNLISHLRSHTKEKPFVCQICEKRFSTKQKCTEHYHCHK